MNVGMGKLIFILSLGLSVSIYDAKLVANPLNDSETIAEAYRTVDFDEDEDDFPDLDAIRAWEEQNPPSFSHITRTLVKDHVSKNKLAYVVGATSAAALAYYFRKHFCDHKYKYLFGTATVLTLGGLYGKWQFDSVMKKTKKSLQDDIILD